MNIVKVVAGFVPFVVFSVLTPVIGVGWAATAGLVAAVLVIAATARGGVKILPCVQAVILLGMALVGGFGNPSVRADLITWGPAAAALIMGAFMIGTARVLPFTAQTARSSVPREIWHSKPFLAINRRISIAWGLAVTIQGVCQLVGTAAGTTGVPLVVRLLLNWVIPVVAYWQAAVYTKHTVAAASQRLHDLQRTPVGNGS